VPRNVVIGAGGHNPGEVSPHNTSEACKKARRKEQVDDHGLPPREPFQSEDDSHRDDDYDEIGGCVDDPGSEEVSGLVETVLGGE
jgi:hypothetical protein